MLNPAIPANALGKPPANKRRKQSATTAATLGNLTSKLMTPENLASAFGCELNDSAMPTPDELLELANQHPLNYGHLQILGLLPAPQNPQTNLSDVANLSKANTQSALNLPPATTAAFKLLHELNKQSERRSKRLQAAAQNRLTLPSLGALPLPLTHTPALLPFLRVLAAQDAKTLAKLNKQEEQQILAQLKALPSANLNAFPIAEINQPVLLFTFDVLKELSPEQLMNIPGRQLPKLSAQELTQLRIEQIIAITQAILHNV